MHPKAVRDDSDCPSGPHCAIGGASVLSAPTFGVFVDRAEYIHCSSRLRNIRSRYTVL
jgi:hypothetical protein